MKLLILASEKKVLESRPSKCSIWNAIFECELESRGAMRRCALRLSGLSRRPLRQLFPPADPDLVTRIGAEPASLGDDLPVACRIAAVRLSACLSVAPKETNELMK